MKKSMTTKTEEETKQFGEEFAKTLVGGDIVCLFGELGAGKTTLVKGIARGLGVKEEITSPTFTLMNISAIGGSASGGKTSKHSNIKSFAHIDTYRLKNEDELVEIGVEDYLGAPNTICVVEWPEKIEGLLKNRKKVNIYLNHGKNGTREITTDAQ